MEVNTFDELAVDVADVTLQIRGKTILSGIDLQNMQLFGFRMRLAGQDLSDHDVFEIRADMINFFYFRGTQCKFMDQLIQVQTGQVYEILDPVH